MSHDSTDYHLGGAARSNLAVGSLLDSKYEIRAFLGSGGMGAVYQAYHSELDHDVAIKVLHGQAADDPDSVKRFQREAHIISELRHKRILSVYAFGALKSLIYMAMEYLPGQSLAAMIADRGPLKVERAAPILLQICEAMSYAHAQHVLHRDLKPSNVIVLNSRDPDAEPSIKVVDFGLARLVGVGEQRLTQTGDVLGDPNYMSPEQCQGRQLDERSDIYSFGCLMYEVLTGKPPFLGESSVASLFKQISDAPPPFPPECAVPSAWQAITLTCLCKDPAQRYQSFQEVADLIKQAIANPRITVQLPVNKQQAEMGRKWKLIAVPLVIAVLVGALTIGILYANYKRQQKESEQSQLEEPIRRLNYRLHNTLVSTQNFEPNTRSDAEQLMKLAKKLKKGEDYAFGAYMLARYYSIIKADQQRAMQLVNEALSTDDLKGEDRLAATWFASTTATSLHDHQTAEKRLAELFYQPHGERWMHEYRDHIREDVIANKFALGKDKEALAICRQVYAENAVGKPEANPLNHAKMARELASYAMAKQDYAEADKYLSTVNPLICVQADNVEPVVSCMVTLYSKQDRMQELKTLVRKIMNNEKLNDYRGAMFLYQTICTLIEDNRLADASHYANQMVALSSFTNDVDKQSMVAYAELAKLRIAIKEGKHDLAVRQGKQLFQTCKQSGLDGVAVTTLDLLQPLLTPEETSQMKAQLDVLQKQEDQKRDAVKHKEEVQRDAAEAAWDKSAAAKGDR